MLPKKLQQKIDARKDKNAFRKLGSSNNLIDFSSNDYLGFSTSKTIFNRASQILKEFNLEENGATGSRLLSGNHTLYNEAEKIISKFHNIESALVFNSGYDANIGFFSSVPQRGDVIFYDELCHASIRDGIKMSNAKSFKFAHNDLLAIEKLLSFRAQSRTTNEEHYLVTESIFSMDGNQPDLKTIVKLCKKYNCHLVIDEAHAIGVFGTQGQGVVQEAGIEKEVFARLITFGKAVGCHGAAILGNQGLKEYLVNYTRSFIYTTGLPPHSIATIMAGYELLEKTSAIKQLQSNIAILQKLIFINNLEPYFIKSDSAIQSIIISGNDVVKKISEKLREKGFDVKPILSPTVPERQERLRICLHSFNTEEEIRSLIVHLSNSIETK